MDLTGVPTPKIDWEATNLPEQWKKFHSHVDLIFKGPLHEKDEEIRVTYLHILLWIENKGREISNTWTDISADDRKKLERHYKQFKDHVQPKLNPIFARFKFNNCVQGAQPVEQFITQLHVLAGTVITVLTLRAR